jgi:cbb3-type cytochrome oxidase maturation protein
MNILLVLIPVTALIVGAGVWLFFWAVNHQQFDDLDSPASLPLLDDPPEPASPAASPKHDPTTPS